MLKVCYIIIYLGGGGGGGGGGLRKEREKRGDERIDNLVTLVDDQLKLSSPVVTQTLYLSHAIGKGCSRETKC